MAFLLSDAAKLTQDMLLRGVIETIINESRVLNYLPFMGVVGSAVDYNQELTLGAADWHAVNDTWITSELTVQQMKASLKILGGDADVDSFLQQTYANKNDIEAVVTESKAKSLAYAFNDAFFRGDHTVNANQFDGLATLAGTPVVGYQNVDATHRAFATATNGNALDLDTMDQLIDMVKPGKPDVLFMSKRSRRKLNSLRRASGGVVLEVGLDQFGRRVEQYDGVRIEIDENISDAETLGSGTGLSSIYAVQFGAQTGVCGLMNGGITVQRINQLETKDASRTRVKWYVGLAVYRSLAYCVLRGIKG